MECDSCGASGRRLVRHHTAYPLIDGPEVIRRLCDSCHRAEHRRPDTPSRPPGYRSLAAGSTERSEIHTYVNAEELEEAHWLAGEWRVSLAEAMRRALREAAKRERVTGGSE